MESNIEKIRQYVISMLEEKLPKGLYFHGVEHTEDVFEVAKRYAKMEGIEDHDRLLLLTAALYHDAGFIERYENNEIIGAKIVAETLPEFGYSQDDIKAIRGIIFATKIPQNPTNHLEQIMCDSDLDNLGRDDFFEKTHALRRELGIKDEMEWYREFCHLWKNTNILQSLQGN